jgi:hypothetical protein
LTHNAQAMLTPAAARGGKNIPEPEVEAEAGLYRTAHGQYAIPGLAFRLALLEAATIFKAPKGSRGSIAPWLAHIEVKEELIPLLNPADRAPLSAYEIDRRPAVVQRQRILRARPRFNNWAIGCMTLLFDEQLVPTPTILPDIMADAGQRKGVGDYRPGKSKGWFGRFAVIGVAYGTGPWQVYTPGGEIARLDEVDPEGVELDGLHGES